MLVRVHVHHDEETNSYWADSPDLDGMVVTGATLDELQSEAMGACEVLLSTKLENQPIRATTRLTYQQPAFSAA
jgi:predicted RNase H-like HicB family nuclease